MHATQQKSMQMMQDLAKDAPDPTDFRQMRDYGHKIAADSADFRLMQGTVHKGAKDAADLTGFTLMQGTGQKQG